MPYRPPDDSRADQVKIWFQSHPELAKQFADKGFRERVAADLRASGMNVTAEDLLNPEVLAELGTVPELEKYFPFVQDSIADKKKAYYDENPDQDPQSTTSKILEFLGLDEPYYNDSRSYDYQQKKWDESVKKGSPDMSWFLPAITESGEQVLEGSMPSVYGNEDPRTANEKYQGAIMGGLNFPLWGMEDEATAYFSSLMNGTPYEQELEQSRRIKEQHAEHTPVWSQVPEIVAGIPLAAPVLSAGVAGAEKGIQGLRKIIGLAPKAKTATGAAIQEAAAVAPATAAEISAYQIGEADGDLDERVKQYDPEMTKNMMLFPAAMGAGGAIRGAMADMGAVGKKVGKFAGSKWDEFWGKGSASSAPTTTTGAKVMPRKPPEPWENPRPPKKPRKPFDLPKGTKPASVRDDIETAIVEAPKRRK